MDDSQMLLFVLLHVRLEDVNINSRPLHVHVQRFTSTCLSLRSPSLINTSRSSITTIIHSHSTYSLLLLSSPSRLLMERTSRHEQVVFFVDVLFLANCTVAFIGQIDYPSASATIVSLVVQFFEDYIMIRQMNPDGSGQSPVVQQPFPVRDVGICTSTLDLKIRQLSFRKINTKQKQFICFSLEKFSISCFEQHKKTLTCKFCYTIRQYQAGKWLVAGQ